MGADYSFYVKTIETHARALLALNILAIGRVQQYSSRLQHTIVDIPKISPIYI